MSFKILFLALLSATLWTSHCLAASVANVKGQKVLIALDGDTASEGEEFFLINPETNKKTAIIRIQKVKGSKALAEVIKGRASQGYTLQAKAPTKMSADVPLPSEENSPNSSNSSSSNSGYLRTLKDSYGITGSYIMSSMTADVSYTDVLGTHRTSASMNGSGFGIGGYYDYVFNTNLAGRAFAGIEQYNVSGTAPEAACKGSTACDAKINYLSLYGLLKWYVFDGPYRTWVGGGAGYLLALSKSSSALNESQISTNQVFTLAIGCDIQRNRKNYIPLSLEYNLFPSSSTVKASMIVIKGGWSWNL